MLETVATVTCTILCSIWKFLLLDTFMGEQLKGNTATAHEACEFCAVFPYGYLNILTGLNAHACG